MVVNFAVGGLDGFDDLAHGGLRDTVLLERFCGQRRGIGLLGVESPAFVVVLIAGVMKQQRVIDYIFLDADPFLDAARHNFATGLDRAQGVPEVMVGQAVAVRRRRSLFQGLVAGHPGRIFHVHTLSKKAGGAGDGNRTHVLSLGS